MREVWWAEWTYEAEERQHLTDTRQREVGHCYIGPDGIKWPSQPPLFIDFGKLTHIEIIPGHPARLRFQWQEKGMPKPAIAGIPVVSELITLLQLWQFIGRLLNPPSVFEVTLPIPKHYETEAPVLAKRFETLMRPPRDVATVQAVLFSVAIVMSSVLVAVVIFLLWWWSNSK
jgi:hypothetical protein